MAHFCYNPQGGPITTWRFRLRLTVGVLIFYEGFIMKVSARNVLKGKVKKITEGMVNAEVVIELPGGQEIIAVVTKTSEQSLGLSVGKEAYAIVKAASVMLGVD